MKPLAPQRFELRCTIDQETHDALRYAQELLSHKMSSDDVAAVLALALKALIPRLEQRRFPKFVQMDHVHEVARGGESTVENLRLRCHAHNQLEAERTFGAEFMRHRRIAAAQCGQGRAGGSTTP